MSGDGDNLFTGHGGPKPTSRPVNAGFFGTVDDAFSSRSLYLPGAEQEHIDHSTNSDNIVSQEVTSPVVRDAHIIIHCTGI